MATARRVDDLDDLRAAGCDVAALDVTDPASIAAVVASIEERYGAVGVLVNNAGYSQSGAIETVSIDAVERQFDTNVYGLVRCVQAVLPGMRRAGAGRVINVSSMGGRFTFPGGGYYHATKHAVEAISDALRFEVRGFGIDVVVIQPGLIRTGFASAATSTIPEPDPSDPYASFNAAVARSTTSAYQKGVLARLGGAPDDVARAIGKAIDEPRPRARYRVTASATALLTLRRALPDALWDRFLRTSFPSPGR